MLTAKQLSQRDGKLTASRVSALMSGDDAKVLNLWREMLGDPSFEPEDLSEVWPVRLGETTEALNLAWYAKKHGNIDRVGEVAIGNPDWMACTLDAWDTQRNCPVECKHVGGREPLETIVARYQPQIHWQMMVTKAQECALSVIMGANEPVVEFLPFNHDYADELMRRARGFMACVDSLTPPVTLPAAAAPVVAAKTYDMTGNNAWANYATVWLRSKSEAEQFNIAVKAIKELIPADAAKCSGYGIVASRNRAGSLTIKGEKQ
jgi:YqaJ-like viral recombinase domain